MSWPEWCKDDAEEERRKERVYNICVYLYVYILEMSIAFAGGSAYVIHASSDRVLFAG